MERCYLTWIFGLIYLFGCWTYAQECWQSRQRTHTAGYNENVNVTIKFSHPMFIYGRVVLIKNYVDALIYIDNKGVFYTNQSLMSSISIEVVTRYIVITFRDVQADDSGYYALQGTAYPEAECWTLYVIDMSVSYQMTTNGYVESGTRIHTTDLPHLTDDVITLMDLTTSLKFHGEVVDEDGLLVQPEMDLKNFTYAIIDTNKYLTEVNITLHVAYLRDIELSNDNLLLVENDTIPDVTCHADCNPSCQFTWKKDGDTISTSQTLQLGRSTFNKSGQYMCVIENNEIMKLQTMDLHVYYQDADISISPKDTIYFLTGKNDVQTVDCVFRCYPSCAISWFKDGTWLHQSATLDIQHMSSGRTGVYTCTAYNSKMNQTTTSTDIYIYDYTLVVKSFMDDQKLIDAVQTGFIVVLTVIIAGMISYLVQQRVGCCSCIRRSASRRKGQHDERQRDSGHINPTQSGQDSYLDLQPRSNTEGTYESIETDLRCLIRRDPVVYSRQNTVDQAAIDAIDQMTPMPELGPRLIKHRSNPAGANARETYENMMM